MYNRKFMKYSIDKMQEKLNEAYISEQSLREKDEELKKMLKTHSKLFEKPENFSDKSILERFNVTKLIN